MNISFTEKQQQYIQDQVASGDFQNASEVVRDAMRLHQIYRTRLLQELRAEIDRGWEGEMSKRTVSDIVKSKRKATV
jgi:antitoxin ParD1/3/4